MEGHISAVFFRYDFSMLSLDLPLGLPSSAPRWASRVVRRLGHINFGSPPPPFTYGGVGAFLLTLQSPFSELTVFSPLAMSAYSLSSFLPARLLLELTLRSLSSLGSWLDPRGGYSSKDLGALYHEDERHLGEKVQQVSVLKLVVSWLKKANTMVINIMC